MTKHAAFLNSAETARLAEIAATVKAAQTERARIMGRIRQRAIRLLLAANTETQTGDE